MLKHSCHVAVLHQRWYHTVLDSISVQATNLIINRWTGNRFVYVNDCPLMGFLVQQGTAAHYGMMHTMIHMHFNMCQHIRVQLLHAPVEGTMHNSSPHLVAMEASPAERSSSQ